jgi:hypothetical protein
MDHDETQKKNYHRRGLQKTWMGAGGTGRSDLSRTVADHFPILETQKGDE